MITVAAVLAIAIAVSHPAPPVDTGGVTATVTVVWGVGWVGDAPTAFGPSQQPVTSTLDVDGVRYEVAAMPV